MPGSRAQRGQEPAASMIWPLYLGGFLGPFAGAMLNTMLPELAGSFGTTLEVVGSAITAYLVPFAALMPLSGVVAARWGAARTVRWAYLLYVIASVMCVLAPGFEMFFAGRVLQGTANAFTTPLLITMIAERVPAGRMGRSLGTYTSMQAAGQAFAPFVGGLAAGIDYRFAFAVVALAAGGLALATPSERRARTRLPRAPWRPLLNWRLGQAGAVAFTVQFVSTGLMLIAALEASDRFGLSPAARGLVVAAFGLAGLMSGRLTGALADRYGMRRTGFAAMLVLTVATGATAFPPTVALLVLAVFVAGVAATGARTMTSTFAVVSTPENRRTATALALSTQFLGSAVAPALVPLYTTSVVAACLAAAAVAAFGAALTALRPR